VPGSSCSVVSGKTTMRFQRAIAADGANQQAILLGDSQMVICARGEDGEKALGYHKTSKGAKILNFQTGVATMPTQPPTSQPDTSDPGTSTTGGIELMAGLSMVIKQADEQGLDLEVTSNRNAWVGIGLPNGESVSMIGESGGGADTFICSDGEVKRYWITSKSSPSNGVAAPGSSCSVVSGKTTMRFQRAIAADGANQNAVLLGNTQMVIFAHGADGQTAVTYHGADKGGALIDFQSGGASEAPKKPAEGLVYAHMIFMAMSWGALLPWGVAIANRTRTVTGAPPGAWFKLHRMLQVAGWVVQLIGFVMILVHLENQGGGHFAHFHTWIGLGVVVLGTLQPLNAAARHLCAHPHLGEKKSPGRLVFEIVHKGSGYIAVAFGMLNCWFGLNVLMKFNYDNTAVAVCITVSALGAVPVICYFILSLIKKDNFISVALMRAKKQDDDNAA